MGEKTAIAWAHGTFNGWWGCVEAGPECDQCYARAFSHRLGLKIWGADAPRRFFREKHWNEPLKWNRAAEHEGVRRRVFCQSMSDVLEDRRDLDEPRERIWRLIEETPMLDWLLLTKRPGKYATLTPWGRGEKPWPKNVWAGTTAGTQKTADVMIPQLLNATRGAAVRWVSAEPLLERVNYSAHLGPRRVSWLVLGGESHLSALKARGCDADWINDGIEQCRNAGAAPFVKQLGTSLHLRHQKGGDPAEWPPELRVREFPRVA